MRDRLQAVRCCVPAGQDRQNTRRTGRRPDIDAGNPRMRVRRANHIGIGLTRQVHVIGVLTGAGQKAGVLAAPNRFANPLRCHLLPGLQKRHHFPIAVLSVRRAHTRGIPAW